MFCPRDGDISSIFTFLELKFRTEIGISERHYVLIQLGHHYLLNVYARHISLN